MYQHYKDVINIMGFSLINVYIFIKSINYTLSSIKKVIMLVLCILCAVIYVSIRLFMPSLMATVIQCIIFIIFIWKLMEIKLDTVISAYLLSYGISYSLLSIVTIIIGFVSIPFINVRYTNDVFYDFNEPIFLLFATLIAIFQFILAFLLFKIKRFRKGFPFLFKKYAVILALIVAGIVLTMISLLTAPRESYEDDYSIPMLFAGIITVGTGIIIWIRRGIKMFYKQNMKERSIELLEQEVSQKERENKLLSEQNDALRIESHKINHRLAALERSVTALAKKIQNNAYSTEFSEELTITIDDIKRLSREYQDGIARIKRKKPLPSTKIKILDDLFEYFSTQYMDNDIEFNLKINGSIPYMVEHIIPQNKLETMIGDHLQDALIAVGKNTNPFRNVLTFLGLADEYYELTIFDSGIAFEVDTLVRLGMERVTTHADTGGSGIGFMTTFETMRECCASLIIHENKPSVTDYSKSVTIRFDGKNQYIIETYRSDNFSSSDERYVLVSHSCFQNQ